MAPQTAGRRAQGPPYPPRAAPLGDFPTPIPDIPVSAVFFALFFFAASFHITNLVRLHKQNDASAPGRLPPTSQFTAPRTPTPGAAIQQANPSNYPLIARMSTFFCFIRIIALSLRMAWATHPGHVSLAIAALEFTSAGVALLLVMNTLLTRRFIRQYSLFANHPYPLRISRALVFCVIACLIMFVSASVDSFYISDEDQKDMRTARDVVLVAGVLLALLATVPVVGLTVAWVFNDVGKVMEDERTGKYRVRKWALVGTAVLLVMEIGFRAGVAFEGRPVGRPGWFDGRAAHYCFVFGIEVMVVYVWVILKALGTQF